MGSPPLFGEGRAQNCRNLFNNDSNVRAGDLELLLDLILSLACVLLCNISTDIELARNPLPGCLQ